jgi:serine/threonine protein kinase
MVDRVGQQLGSYRLSRLLGKGGFAEVYLGEHVYLKTLAALKLLQIKVGNEQDLQDFLKEAQTIAQLVHPHIVRVLDFGVDGETPFLVMDYATGGTLRQRHPRGTQLPLNTIIPYIKQVAEALSYAHEEKFIHRDVKPENMLLGRREEVLLSDFGIALIAQSSRYQSTQEVIGTVAYMAPEQIQGKPRPASDQYSLGIVIYEWLCGNRPFHGSFTELCTQHMFAPPPPLRDRVPTLAPAVEEVVLTALAKDPHQRFASIRAFANALEQASQAEQERASAPTLLNMTLIPPAQPAEEPPLSLFSSAPTLPASSDKEVEPSVPVASPSENAPVSAAPIPDTISTPSASESLITPKPVPSLPVSQLAAPGLSPPPPAVLKQAVPPVQPSAVFASSTPPPAQPRAPGTPQKTKEQWYSEGNTHLQAKRYEASLAAYEQAIGLDANYASAYNGTGLALYRSQRYQKALAAYEQAIRLVPNKAVYYDNKGLALFCLQHYQEALAAHEQAIRLAPNNADTYNNKGLALFCLQRYQEALDTFVQAIRIDPNYAAAYNNKGNALKKLGESRAAKQAYKEARQLGYTG